MPGWQGAVEIEITDMVILPAHRIMQRMGPGIAPVAVEPIALQRRTGTAELDEFGRRELRHFGPKRLDFRNRNRGLGNGRGIGLCGGTIQDTTCAGKQRIGRMNANGDITDAMDRVRILVAVFDGQFEERA